MFHDPIESIIGEAKEDFLIKLSSMYLKNSSILNLIEKINLEWACPPLNEYMSTTEIIDYLKQLKTNDKMKKTESTPDQQMKNAIDKSNNAGKKFQNEAPDNIPDYVKFETKGDTIEGRLIGFAMMPSMNDKTVKEKRFIIIDNDDLKHKILPFNLQLVNKLSFVESTVGGVLSEANSKEVQIIFEGKIQHPTKPDQEIAQFKVNY